jgi:hypothetical protein
MRRYRKRPRTLALTQIAQSFLIPPTSRQRRLCAKGFAMPPDPRSCGRLTHPAVVAAAGVLLLILLGCMSISIGKFGSTSSTTESDGTFCQEGEVTLAANELREVFYPVPYVNTPNLEVDDTFHNCLLVAQRENSFSVRNDAAHSVTVSWKARGMRGTPVTARPAVTVDAVLPPPAGPPVDEPVGKAH